MNLSKFSLEELVLAALKAEIDAENAYSILANRVKNALLKDRLKFLAEEEKKHEAFVRVIHKKTFPDKDLVVPAKSPVPLPEIKVANEMMRISEVLDSAMQAEKAAHEFYKKLAERFFDDKQIYGMLMYFSAMELGHYKLLEIEKTNADKFEEMEAIWPLIHVGP